MNPSVKNVSFWYSIHLMSTFYKLNVHIGHIGHIEHIEYIEHIEHIDQIDQIELIEHIEHFGLSIRLGNQAYRKHCKKLLIITSCRLLVLFYTKSGND